MLSMNSESTVLNAPLKAPPYEPLFSLKEQLSTVTSRTHDHIAPPPFGTDLPIPSPSSKVLNAVLLMKVEL